MKVNQSSSSSMNSFFSDVISDPMIPLQILRRGGEGTQEGGGGGLQSELIEPCISSVGRLPEMEMAVPSPNCIASVVCVGEHIEHVGVLV